MNATIEKRYDIKSATFEELTDYMREIGEKPYRAKQLFAWMHEKKAASFDDMSNLPKTLRQTLFDTCDYTMLTQVDCRISKDDGTRKYLFALSDGNVIESVLMRYDYGLSACISSQVGCRMGCKFCASTIDGLVRNLTASEMVEQIYAMERDIGEHIGHVVVMGTGEPLDNYDNLLRFLQLISDERGDHLSQRNITVSTCGIVENIRRLATEKLQITLALSLHAPNQAKRKELMPVANKYDIHEVVDACRAYFAATGRRITFEYSLVAGVNDDESDAKELASLIGDFNCHINLIPVNPIKERDYKQSKKAAVFAFQKRLESYGIHATVRRTLGADIDASCGQLRKRYMDGN